MRTIRIKLYKFSELSKDAQFKALCDQIRFEIETADKDSWINPIAQKLDKMQTPWFLSEELYHNHKQILIDTIEANEYEFTKDGKIN